MTTVLPDLGLIEALDFQPACESGKCEEDHPAATHQYTWKLPCCAGGNLLICKQCAVKIIAKWSRLYYAHDSCNRAWAVDRGRWRVEVLP